jgi:hypothetical protein
MLPDRPNSDLAAAVNHALTLIDRIAAAHFLEARGAGLALICRVLMEPERRRPRPQEIEPTITLA